MEAILWNFVFLCIVVRVSKVASIPEQDFVWIDSGSTFYGLYEEWTDVTGDEDRTESEIVARCLAR